MLGSAGTIPSAPVGLLPFVLDRIETPQLNVHHSLRHVHTAQLSADNPTEGWSRGQAAALWEAGPACCHTWDSMEAVQLIQVTLSSRRAPCIYLVEMLGCLESSYLDSNMLRCLVSPLNGRSGSIRPTVGGAVTPPCPRSPQLVFGWHLLSDLPSVGFYPSRALKCHVCRRLWVRPAVGHVLPGWSHRSPCRCHQESYGKAMDTLPQKTDDTHSTERHTYSLGGGHGRRVRDHKRHMKDHWRRDVSLRHCVCRIPIKSTLPSMG